MHRSRTALVLAALALLSAACGARLNEQQLKAASGSSNQAAGATGAEGVTAGGSGTDASSGTGGGAATPAAGGGATAAGGSGGGSAGAATPAGGGGTASKTAAAPGDKPSPAPAGGNGGATDIGVTANEIALGNIATVTGPVPGLFRGALLGAQAFAAYQNSLGGINGRKLRIIPADDRLDSGQNRAAATDLSKKALAFLGSFSLNDDGMVDVVKGGVPDVGYSLGDARKALPDNFSPQPLPPGWRLGPLNYFKEKFPSAITKVAGFYGNVASARAPYQGQKKAAESLGYKYVYERELSATEANYTADVIQMKNQGAQAIFMSIDVGNMARMAKALQQQGLKLQLPNYGANAYDPKFLSLAGTAAEGALIDQQLAMFGGEDAGSVPEIGLFLKWMKSVDPSFKPDIFAAFSWASGRLFAQAAQAAGPKLTRAALLDQLRKIDNFDANGMVAPSGPASKRPPTCFMVIKVQGGKFVRADPPSKGFICDKGGYFRA